MPSRSLQSISVDDFKFGFLNLLHGWSKRVSKRCPMAFNLVQCSITAGLRHCNHALDPLELIKVIGQRVGHDRASPRVDGERQLATDPNLSQGDDPWPRLKTYIVQFAIR